MDTRERIVTEARELFLREGLEGFSMRALGERVGVSAPAIYRHFDDKDALLATLIDGSFSTFATYLVRALSGKTPIERLRKTGEAYFAFALEHPQDYRLMFLTDCRELGFIRISEEIENRALGTFQFLVDRVKECMDAGLFAARDPLPTALAVWSQTHGLASLWLLGNLEDKLDEAGFRAQVGLCLDLIELSLRSREAPLRQ